MIKIKLSPTNQDFITNYQNILDTYQEETQIFTANLESNANNELLPKVCYRGGVYCNDQLELLFLNANPHNLVLFSLNNNLPAIEFLVKDLIANQIEIRGILSNNIVCDHFIAEYSKVSPAVFTLHLAMNIMRLDNLIKPVLKGELIPSTLDNNDFIYNYLYNFSNEALGERPTRAQLIEKYHGRIINHKFFIYINENKQKTSIIMLSRDLKDGKAITAVYTLPEFRGQGYATSMVYYACEYIFNQGFKYATLFVDKNNPISNHVYEKLGFYVLTNSYDYRLK